MSIKKTGLALLVATTLFSTRTIQAETTIEGASEETLQEHSALLKGVLRLGMRSGMQAATCSATRIATNVLLTAKHCVSGFTSFSIQGLAISNPNIIQSPYTDIALIKFSSNPALDVLLADATIIPVSLEQDQKLYQGEVLLAGYGLTHMERRDSGNLRAGVNNIVEGTPLIEWFLKNLALENGNHYKFKPQHIHIMGVRQDVYKNAFNLNQVVEVEDRFVSSSVPKDQALGLSGDSGSSVMAFDRAGEAVVIGVASTVSPVFFGSTVVEITLKETETGSEKTVILDKVINGDTAANNENFFSALIEAGFIAEKTDPSSKYIALRAFSYTYKINRIAMNEYEATGHSENAKFIAETLAAFAE